MGDHVPGEPDPGDLREAAERSLDAGIADESASYATAAGNDAERQDADGIPQTGEEDPLAQVSDEDSRAGAAEFARAERVEGAEDLADDSDSIEPGRIPGSAEGIEVAGVTGPGPSG